MQQQEEAAQQLGGGQFFGDKSANNFIAKADMSAISGISANTAMGPTTNKFRMNLPKTPKISRGSNGETIISK